MNENNNKIESHCLGPSQNRLADRISFLEDENRKLKNFLNVLRRKVSHGCVDASCKECDEHREEDDN